MGYTIPKGDYISLLTRFTYIDPKAYSNSLSFEPNRWKDSSVPQALPFGGGTHRCKGEHFAMAVMKTCTAMLLRDYEVEVVSGDLNSVKWEALWPRFFPKVIIHKRK